MSGTPDPFAERKKKGTEPFSGQKGSVPFYKVRVRDLQLGEDGAERGDEGEDEDLPDAGVDQLPPRDE